MCRYLTQFLILYKLCRFSYSSVFLFPFSSLVFYYSTVPPNKNIGNENEIQYYHFTTCGQPSLPVIISGPSMMEQQRLSTDHTWFDSKHFLLSITNELVHWYHRGEKWCKAGIRHTVINRYETSHSHCSMTNFLKHAEHSELHRNEAVWLIQKAAFYEAKAISS